MRPHTKKHQTFVSTNQFVFCANQAFTFLTLPFLIVSQVFKAWHLIHPTNSWSISNQACFVVLTSSDLGVRVFELPLMGRYLSLILKGAMRQIQYAKKQGL